ncbi:sensor histidine kinase [Vibrio hannami]|uniref:sensor histidine kinase n=1 Tax=Vibrio hannami TaxID=2717094 RepID=UPI003EB7698A
MIENRLSNKSNHWIKSYLVTTVVCVVIAAFTRTLWPGPYLQHLAISFGFGYSSIISANLLAYFFPKLTTAQNSILSMLFAVIVGTVHAHFWLSTYDGYSAQKGLLSVVILGIIFTSVCFNYFYHYEKKLIAEAELEKLKRQESEKEKALVLSQLSQLQSQIEPHFLFNTLANILALIENDNDKAKSMLNKLTELLRANLKITRESLTTIEQEMALLNAYLGIQQIRLAERLKFHISCDEQIKLTSLPPLLVQPLVENAISHGIEPKPEGGTINVEFKQTDSCIVITVDDDGQGLSDQVIAGHGIGLSNIRNRLKVLFDDGADLSITEKESGGVTASITLPHKELNALHNQK